MASSIEQRRQLKQMDSQSRAAHQLSRLNALLQTILPQNRFYAEKLAGVKLPLDSLDALSQLPFTFKSDLVGTTDDDVASNLTFPRTEYIRFHRTSGTRGRAMIVLDDEQSWRWWIDGWQFVLDAAEIDQNDRVLMAFSFGPFIGFWTAFDAAVQRGALVIPGGGLSTMSRLEIVCSAQVTALFCTPTYALHMAEVASANQLDIASSGVRRIVVAGEPGGSVPAIRQRIQSTWNAKVIDHAGATEIGPWGFADAQGRGLYINESEFIAEFISTESGTAVEQGELAELVLTTLGRAGAPVIRYRTGDLVRPTRQTEGQCQFAFLEGGVLGRADQMMIIRGINVFPSSVDQILRGLPGVLEYRTTAYKSGEMDALRIEIEDELNDPARVAESFHVQLGLKVDVTTVPLGSLPRFEGKGHRFIDQRE